jgi:hypothetical protein
MRHATAARDSRKGRNTGASCCADGWTRSRSHTRGQAEEGLVSRDRLVFPAQPPPATASVKLALPAAKKAESLRLTLGFRADRRRLTEASSAVAYPGRSCSSELFHITYNVRCWVCTSTLLTMPAARSARHRPVIGIPNLCEWTASENAAHNDKANIPLHSLGPTRYEREEITSFTMCCFSGVCSIRLPSSRSIMPILVLELVFCAASHRLLPT